MGNVALTHKKGLSSFRMLAMGTWHTAKDPSVYGAMEVPMDASLRFRVCTISRALRAPMRAHHS